MLLPMKEFFALLVNQDLALLKMMSPILNTKSMLAQLSLIVKVLPGSITARNVTHNILTNMFKTKE